MRHSTAAVRPAAGGDPGLYGPGSVTWQCHGDPVMWIAGVRALYLQALHPRAVRGGVMENSDFRADAWGRLLRTADFVGTLTYGTTDAAERAGARVRRIHRTLSATDPVTEERFPVDDPALLLWVHCAQIDSFLHVLRRSGVPLTPAQADRYVDENRVNACLVGLDPDGVPADTAQLAAYFEKVRPELAAGADAREVDDFPECPARPPAARPWPKPAVAAARRPRVRIPPRLGARAVRETRAAPRAPSPGACASLATCCAPFPQVCAGSCLQVTS
ncbi:hypothetical protein GCM10020254_71810 [Streptomyces goshikiensis]